MAGLFQALKEKLSVFWNCDAASEDEKTRLQYYLVFMIAGIPTMIMFGLYSLIKGNYTLFTIVLFSAGGLFSGCLFLRGGGNARNIYRFNAVLFSLLVIYMFAIGGDGGSKSLWMYTFPLISFFLFGKNEGVFWSSAVIIIALFLLFNPFELFEVYNYSSEFKIRFVTSYFIVAAVTYWFEYFRHHYREILEIRNKNLQQEISDRKQAESEKEKLIVELQNALVEVKTLSGFLPICSTCKKIRDDQGYWNRIETYISTHSDAQFSHGICPDCAKKLYPDYVN